MATACAGRCYRADRVRQSLIQWGGVPLGTMRRHRRRAVVRPGIGGRFISQNAVSASIVSGDGSTVHRMRRHSPSASANLSGRFATSTVAFASFDFAGIARKELGASGTTDRR